MKDEKNKQDFYGRLGSDYYWFAGHYALANMLLDRFVPEENTAAPLLNIGCGPNEFTPSSKMQRQISADYSFAACRMAKAHNRYATVVCCDAQSLPFKSGTIGTVVALEVLEHLEQDHLAGKEFGRVLEKHGILLVSVPAYRLLWGSHDEWNRHVRRYSTGTFQTFVRRADLRTTYRTYYKLPFVIPLYLFRKIKRILGAGDASHDFLPLPRPINTLLTWYLLGEAMVARFVPLPAGVSIFGVLRPAERD